MRHITVDVEVDVDLAWHHQEIAEYVLDHPEVFAEADLTEYMLDHPEWLFDLELSVDLVRAWIEQKRQSGGGEWDFLIKPLLERAMSGDQSPSNTERVHART